MVERLARHAVAVVGAGTAGIFASGELAKTGAQVVLINRDIKPGGLAEYGIFHRKHDLKQGLRNQFAKILQAPNIHYFGGITIGEDGDFSLSQLSEMGFSAVLVAAGAQGTKHLGLPGEQLPMVYHAKEIVYHYNGLPPYSQQQFPVGEHVIIIGMGNVMADIANWLIHDLQVKTVVTVGRRGPAEVKFSKQEWSTIAANLDKVEFEREIDTCLSVMQAVNQNVEEIRDCLLQEVTKAKPATSTTRLWFDFFASPSRIVADEQGNVVALEVEETILQKSSDGSNRAIGTGVMKQIPADTIIFSIGDRVDREFGLPVDRDSFATNPTPVFPVDSTSYESYEPLSGEGHPGYFITGWARSASGGKVGQARKDGANCASSVMQYLETLESDQNPQLVIENFQNRINQLSKMIVSKEDWEKILEAEQRIAQEKGLEHFVFISNEEMIASLSEE